MSKGEMRQADLKGLSAIAKQGQTKVRLKDGTEHMVTKGDTFLNEQGELLQAFVWKGRLRAWNVTEDTPMFFSLIKGSLELIEAENSDMWDTYARQRMQGIEDNKNTYLETKRRGE